MKFRKLKVGFRIDWDYSDSQPTIKHRSKFGEVSIRTKKVEQLEKIIKLGKRAYEGIIYCITQIKDPNDKVLQRKKPYIGKTKDFNVRWAKYKRDAFNFRRFDSFHKELRKYNRSKLEDYWTFAILEICYNATDLHNRELDWIKEYYGNPPNFDLGWNSKFGRYKKYVSSYLDEIPKRKLEYYIKLSLKISLNDVSAKDFISDELGISNSTLEKWIAASYTKSDGVGMTYTDVRMKFVKERLEYLIKQAYLPYEFGELLSLKPDRAATQINRWCHDLYGKSFLEIREEILKSVFQELIRHGLKPMDIHKLRLIPGYTLRTIYEKIRVWWGSFQKAKKSICK